jgi:acyl-CoA reductase-like NAD-dependent aldehyde dehydrogenase
MIYQLNMNRVKPRELWGILGKPIQYLSCSRFFGGVKESGFGRENHKMALDHYRVVKQVNLLRQRTG